MGIVKGKCALAGLTFLFRGSFGKMGLLILALGLNGVVRPTPLAQATGSLVLEAVFTSDIQNGWVRVERWRDRNPYLTQEDFLPDGRLDQSGQRETFFGSPQPPSSQFLLYYAPGWDGASPSVPVLLVHGAYGNADWAWANPRESPLGCGALSCPSTGLMQFLSARGYRVFAVSFAHPAGDNFFWSEHIANAIRVIRKRTGTFQVDVIAWSKGAIAARMYVSGVRRDWGTPYRGDIRRLILIAGPNGGGDWVFRHGIYPNFWIYPECGGRWIGASAHTVMSCGGIYYSHPELSIYRTAWGDSFRGLRQLVWPWDEVYPLPWWEPDWWTTYYGGWGMFSYSRGIAEAKADSLIPTLRANPTPADVSVYLLCGNMADLPYWHNEHAGPSDGLIFLESCRDRQGLANVQGESVLALNHLRIVWDPTAMAQVEAWLR